MQMPRHKKGTKLSTISSLTAAVVAAPSLLVVVEVLPVVVLLFFLPVHVVGAPLLAFRQNGSSFSFVDASSPSPAWLVSAPVRFGAGDLEPLPGGPRHYQGRDGLGPFKATAHAYILPKPAAGILTATIRVYDATADADVVVVFEQLFNSSSSSSSSSSDHVSGLSRGPALSAAQKQVSTAFPSFRAAPSPPSPPAPPPNCTLYEEMDFNGADLVRTTAPSAKACCVLCAAHRSCAVFTWYHTRAGGAPVCDLKSYIERRLSHAINHTSGICHRGGGDGAATEPPLNAFTTWGPSGMFNELTRLWSADALSNAGTCNDIGNDKGCDGMGPLVIYDRTLTSLVISPLDQFLSHQISASDDSNGSTTSTIDCGLRGTVQSVPDGYRISTLVVGGRGVTRTVTEWGRLLLAFYGKPPAAQTLATAYSRDPSLRYLSYWTDAGAAYYYQVVAQNGRRVSAEQTMKDVKAWMVNSRIPTTRYGSQLLVCTYVATNLTCIDVVCS
jgi:hypothetical protein